MNKVNLLYFINVKMIGHIKESNGNKYLTLVPTNEGKDTLKKYEELWNKIKDLVKSIINDSNNYD